MLDKLQEKNLFIPHLPVSDMHRFALPVHSWDSLRHLTRHRSLWILGASTVVRERLQELLQAIKPNVRALYDVYISLTENNAEKIKKILSRAEGDFYAEHIFLLAEEDYGKAFAAFCNSIEQKALVITPVGYAALAIPGTTSLQVGPLSTSSSVYPLAKMAEVLNGTKVLIWDSPIERTSYFDKVLHAFNISCTIVGRVGGDTLYTTENSVVTAQKIEPSLAIEFDYVLTSNSLSEVDFLNINISCKEFTPLIKIPDSLIRNFAYLSFTTKLFTSEKIIKARKAAPPRDYLNIEKYNAIYAERRNELSYYEGLYECTAAWAYKGCKMVHKDRKNKFCSYTNGYRDTCYQNDTCDHNIYIMGNSCTVGYFTEDRHTISSYLQNLLNSQNKEKKSTITYNVHNRAIISSPWYNLYLVILDIQLKPGDIIIANCSPNLDKDLLGYLKGMQEHCKKHGALFAVFCNPDLRLIENTSEYEKELLEWDMMRLNKISWGAEIEETKKIFDEFITVLTASGIPCFSMQKYFERPHDYGELFIDYFHTAYRGNEIIAKAMYELFIGNIHRIKSSDVYEKALASTIEDIKAHALSSKTLWRWLEAAPRFAGAEKFVGAIVMNCNPFTIGHKYIIEKSLEQVDFLYIFIVQEDLSYFSYEDRLAMMLAGTEEFRERIRIVPSGDFIISAISFPEYFVTDAKDVTPDLTVEAVIFGTIIARELGITKRFLGEEPFCPVTHAYHDQLKSLLPRCGVECVEIPRLCSNDGMPISASYVRKRLEAGEFDKIQNIIPATSVVHLMKRINALRRGLHKGKQ